MTPARQCRQRKSSRMAWRAPPEKPVVYTLAPSTERRACVSSIIAPAASSAALKGPLRELFEPTTTQPKRSAASLKSSPPTPPKKKQKKKKKKTKTKTT